MQNAYYEHRRNDLKYLFKIKCAIALDLIDRMKHMQLLLGLKVKWKIPGILIKIFT